MGAYARAMTTWPSLFNLELFVAIVESGSIGGGARRIGIAQPHASHIVSELERSLGAPLLERRPSGSTPTELGIAYAAQARQLLEAAQHFVHWSQSHPASLHQVVLRVGASMTIAETLVPTWVAALHADHPHIAVDLRVLNSKDVLLGIRDGALQLGLVETPHLPPDLQQKQIGTDHLVLVVAPTHPWATRTDPLTIEELARTQLVVREAGSGTRRALDEVLSPYNPVPPAQVLYSNMAVRIAVAAGGAPAVLSELAVHEQLLSGQLIEVPVEQIIPRPLAAVWKSRDRLTGAAALLIRSALSTGVAGWRKRGDSQEGPQ